MEKMIIFCEQQAKVGCDEKCNKAWGMNSRPRIDEKYCSDDELEEAPIDPGTYEKGHAKPSDKFDMLNIWCVRECERCSMSSPGKYNEPLKLKDFK